jgi:hypothetical protein
MLGSRTFSFVSTTVTSRSLYEYGDCCLAAFLSKYLYISYKAGQPVFLLMWLLYLAVNHMYSVAYQQHCTHNGWLVCRVD